MIIVTTNDIPGYRIDTTLGECFGLTVRSRHIGSNIGASFKSLAGGELRGITELLLECRQEALSRLAQEAGNRGANAVVAFRFETTEYAQTGIEVCAYGTAVQATQLTQQVQQGFDQGAHHSQPVGQNPQGQPGQPTGGQPGLGQAWGTAPAQGGPGAEQPRS